MSFFNTTTTTTTTKDPEIYISRNAQLVFNPAHFSLSPSNLHSQSQARTLMQEIYSVPITSQRLVATLLVDEHPALAPYMWYEAVRSGHAEVTKALRESGKVGLGRGPGGAGWEASVREHGEKRAEEVFGLEEEERTEGLRRWLAEFGGQESNTLMFHAAAAGAKDIILRLLELGIIPHSDANLTLVPLHAACYNGHLECAKLLVASGMNINCRDEFGGTALMRAAVGGRTEIVRWLLENHAKPHFRESREGKYNALEYGAGQDVEIVKMLLEACGWSPTALMGAASFGKTESFELIAQEAGLSALRGSRVDVTFWENELSAQQKEAIVGALDRGGSGGNAGITQFVLAFIPAESNERENIRKAFEQSALRATLGNHAQIVRLLLDFRIASQVDKDTVQAHVNELLLAAANSGSVETARLLLEKYCADVNYRDRPNQTNALYNAVVNDHPEMIEVLAKEYHADIHQASGKFANGPTPLWLAIDRQHEMAARALLLCGGPVEFLSVSCVEGTTTRVFVSADQTYRAPVKLRTVMEPAWDDEHSTERFLCLEYPDGWPGGVQLRRPDAELKDDRELKQQEDGGFVVV